MPIDMDPQERIPPLDTVNPGSEEKIVETGNTGITGGLSVTSIPNPFPDPIAEFKIENGQVCARFNLGISIPQEYLSAMVHVMAAGQLTDKNRMRIASFFAETIFDQIHDAQISKVARDMQVLVEWAFGKGPPVPPASAA